MRVLPEGAEGVTLSETGRYRLQLEAPDRVPSVVFEVDAALGSTVDLADIALARGGSVRLAIGNWPAAPVAQLRARWHDADGRARETTSAPEAEWLLEGVAPGRVTLDVEALGTDGSTVRRVELLAEVRASQVTALAIDLGGD